MAFEPPPLTEENAHHWYHAEHKDIVALQHGTSEGSLASILKNGFQPMKQDITETVREVLADYFPLAAITAELVQEVTSHHTHRGMRALQNNDQRTIFACLAPSDSAADYAVKTATSGGEFARGVHEVIEFVLPHRVQEILGTRSLPPRYAGARPVVVEFDAPKNQLIGFPDTTVREYEAMGFSSFSSLAGIISDTQISVIDARSITIKSVTFASQDSNGKWSFEGQPQLSPQEALEEIQDKFKKNVAPTASKFAGPRETASDLVKSIGLQAEEFIRERVTPENMEPAAKRFPRH